MTEHPMQPIVIVDGVVRFQKNELIRFLLDFASVKGFGMNEIAMLDKFSAADRSQLAQLIGYSVSGYGELDYAQRVAEADEIADKLING